MKYTCYDDIICVESAWVRLATVAINGRGGGGVVVAILITAYVAPAAPAVAAVVVSLLLRMRDCVYVCKCMSRNRTLEQRRCLTSC